MFLTMLLTSSARDANALGSIKVEVKVEVEWKEKLEQMFGASR